MYKVNYIYIYIGVSGKSPEYEVSCPSLNPCDKIYLFSFFSLSLFIFFKKSRLFFNFF